MQPFSVSAFLEYLNTALSAAVFPEGVVVEGEVAEYRVSQGKWIWFLLKDKDAVVPCFATVWQLRTPLEDGMHVRVSGTPKIHQKSGKFSLTVNRAELVGEGALRRAFAILQARLTEEGIFAMERKRPLPRFPRRVGIIASRESAAYGDFLRILGNRWGGVEARLYHVQVQGASAIGDILRAFAYFNAHPDEAEVIVLTRGGGSLEDLQAFNAEEVARAVYASRIPVLAGVGHERDETLADLAADVRASTPSNAAELLVPDRAEMQRELDTAARRMSAAIIAEVADRRHRVDALAARLGAFVRHRAEALRVAVARLFAAARQRVRAAESGVASMERMLRSLDPKRLLARGYAVVRTADGAVVKDARAAPPGSALRVQLHHGALEATVTETHP